MATEHSAKLLTLEILHVDSLYPYVHTISEVAVTPPDADPGTSMHAAELVLGSAASDERGVARGLASLAISLKSGAANVRISDKSDERATVYILSGQMDPGATPKQIQADFQHAGDTLAANATLAETEAVPVYMPTSHLGFTSILNAQA